MNNFARAMGFTLAVLSTGVLADEPVVSSKNGAVLLGGGATIYGTEALFSGAKGGKGPSLFYDLAMLKETAVPKEVLNLMIKNKLEALRLENGKLRAAQAVLENSGTLYPKLGNTTAARATKSYLLQTDVHVGKAVSDTTAEIEKSKATLRQLRREIPALNAQKKLMGAFSKADLTRAGLRWAGWVAGGAILYSETSDVLKKWDAKKKRLVEPTVEDLEDLRYALKKAQSFKGDRKPAVLTGKNGAIQRKYLEPSELDAETTDHGARAQHGSAQEK